MCRRSRGRARRWTFLTVQLQDGSLLFMIGVAPSDQARVLPEHLQPGAAVAAGYFERAGKSGRVAPARHQLSESWNQTTVSLIVRQHNVERQVLPRVPDQRINPHHRDRPRKERRVNCADVGPVIGNSLIASRRLMKTFRTADGNRLKPGKPQRHFIPSPQAAVIDDEKYSRLAHNPNATAAGFSLQVNFE